MANRPYTTEQLRSLATLDSLRERMTVQEYKTFRGQIIANDMGGAAKGIRRMFAKKQSESMKP
jgi:hypothetical protein